MGQERDFFLPIRGPCFRKVRVFRSTGISVRAVKTTYHVTYRRRRRGLPSPSPRPNWKCGECVFFLLRPTGETRSSMRHVYIRRNQLVTRQRHSSYVIRPLVVPPTTIRACLGGWGGRPTRVFVWSAKREKPSPHAEQWISERRFNDRVVCRPMDNEPQTTRPGNSSKYNIRVHRGDDYLYITRWVETNNSDAFW